MSLKHALAATELYLQHNENPLLKRGLDIKELAKTMTNGDRIRAMTDEELADNVNCLGCPESQEIISCSKFGSCRDCWLGWLQQPVKEDAE